MSALVLAAGGGIGDVLLATPLIRALREKYGDVVALVAPAHRPVLNDNPDVADVWADDVPFARQLARISARRFDAAFVTWATLRAAALPFLARIPVRVGQSRRAYSGLFTHPVERRSDRGDHTSHWTQILLDLGRAVGCDVADATPVFVVPATACTSLARTLAAHGVGNDYVVLHPTRGIAAARGRWPAEPPFATLATDLARETGATVVITGAPGEEPIANAVAAASGAISLAGQTTLAEFGALALGARAVVAMDAGPMHVAAAVGAPTVGIFALQSDEPGRWAPLGPRVAIVPAQYPCPPGHRKETCPNFACVAALDSARVLATLNRLVPRARV